MGVKPSHSATKQVFMPSDIDAMSGLAASKSSWAERMAATASRPRPTGASVKRKSVLSGKSKHSWQFFRVWFFQFSPRIKLQELS